MMNDNSKSPMDIAVELVIQLGETFADICEAEGEHVDRRTPLSNGLVAYQMLELKGEVEILDEAVDMVLQTIYEHVVTTMTKH